MQAPPALRPVLDQLLTRKLAGEGLGMGAAP